MDARDDRSVAAPAIRRACGGAGTHEGAGMRCGGGKDNAVSRGANAAGSLFRSRARVKTCNYFIERRLPRGELDAEAGVEPGVREDGVARAPGGGGIVFGLDWNEFRRFDAELPGCASEDGLSETVPGNRTGAGHVVQA